MRESLRAAYIVRLIDDISHIGPGPSFERFGAKFLDHHLGIALIHRGLSPLLSPVGHTIDSYDDAGLTGAEYSIDQDYFTGSMPKTKSDLLHVLRKHPTVVDIFLLSSQRAPAAAIPAFIQSAVQWPGMHGRNLHLYDARRIAEVIVDDLLPSDAAIEDLVEHLPVLANIIDDAAANLAVPKVDERHIARPMIGRTIAEALRDGGPIVTISGIGGLGKSEAAAAYAAEHRRDYDTCMWIDGDALRRPEDLKAISLWRGGDARNLAAMLAARKCLLIIDDIVDSILAADLARFCGPGSHIILTRRTPRDGDLILPMLTNEEARSILDHGLAISCPDEVLAQLLATVGGHPLSLALVNRVVTDGTTWTEAAEDCAAIPELTLGDQRLADRLLGRLANALSGEVQLFEWAGQPSCDLRFLRYAIGPIGIAKLRRHGLTAADRPTTLKLHNIIHASVMAQHWLTAERADQLDDQLESFIEQLMVTGGLGLRVLAATMRAKLEALADVKPRPAFAVALLEIWKATEIRPELLTDPASEAERLATCGVLARPAEVRAVLETIEGLYRHDKLGSFEAARERLRARLPIFGRLSALDGLDSRSATEIKHHYAKALKILGMDAEAQDMFEEVLLGTHPLYASRLQLVRLYGRSKDTIDKAAEQADAILTAASNPGDVSSNVVLATLQALPSTGGAWRQKFFNRHADLIEREIVIAAEAGVEDAFLAFAAAARHWSWHDRDRLLRVFASLEVIDPASLEDRTRAACGELFGEIAKGPDGVDAEFQKRALRYYEAVETPQDFGLQKHGQLLVEMGRGEEAEAVLLRISRPQPFAFYWLSKAQLQQGKLDDAIVAIDKALNELKASQARFRAAFLAHRFDVRRELSDPAAREDLLEAHRLCEDPKYKVMLERRLAEQPAN